MLINFILILIQTSLQQFQPICNVLLLTCSEFLPMQVSSQQGEFFEEQGSLPAKLIHNMTTIMTPQSQQCQIPTYK